MEKFLKWSILDELYNYRSEEFADNVFKEMKKQNEKFEAFEIEEKLKNKIEEVVQEPNSRKDIVELLNKFELKEGKEDDFWNKMYYKLGFYDCTEFKNILQSKIQNHNDEQEKKIFLDDYTDDFMGYLEENRMARLRKVEEYMNIENEINRIKNNNPKVRLFIDDRENVELSKEELDNVLKILNLQGDLENFEYKETFKLGVKEMILFLKQMEII